MLAGKDSQSNRHTVYLAEQRGKIAATRSDGVIVGLASAQIRETKTAVFTTAERHDPLKHQALQTLGFVSDGRTQTVQAEGAPLELILYEIQNTGIR